MRSSQICRALELLIMRYPQIAQIPIAVWLVIIFIVMTCLALIVTYYGYEDPRRGAVY